jgi:predicted small metal-binding protein
MTDIQKTRLQCPCGEFFQAKDEDDLVEQAQRHLKERHPHLEYDREDILFMAY